MRYMLTAAALLMVTNVACFRSPTGGTTSKRGMPLVGVDPKIVNLGSIDADTNARKQGYFQITNRGTIALNIIGMDVTCGCTANQVPYSHK